MKSTQKRLSLGALFKIICLFLLITGMGSCLVCGCVPLQTLPAPHPESGTGKAAPVDSNRILALLNQQMEAWEGVPYRLGGLSKAGVDCSGFVYMTYLTRFNIRLPRSTYRQSQAGDYVFPRDLRAGDLLFFRLGSAARHVGIYLENGLFAHASKSNGVTVSSLEDAYWSKRFWKAVRIKIDSF